ncbi:MAG: 16S rRNA (adenine(1518)-N(6)/adenine(1519)-N(6))-dimethyltransferase RsmA [Bdellovibrionales bacterium]|nr:16S rRNA (adenine(1518)-N(6)/adenine(1519)-N(6))-dimethyltransferase RsmA [Bdellovibrionales bacterium]
MQPSALKQRLIDMGIEPKRSLGQNFLTNQHVIEKIITKAEAHLKNQLIEIGPGPGSLTDYLKKLTPQFTLLELDRKIAQYWRDQGLKVLEQDALKADWQELTHEGPTLLVSNLPYQISSSLVVELSTTSHQVEAMILMFQKEVAERIVAAPNQKTYGLLSVVAQLTWDIQKLADAGPGSFFPPPKVASRVLSFQKKQEPLSKEFLNFVKACFQQRRKQVLKVLIHQKQNSVKDTQIFDWLESKGYGKTLRAENISADDYVELYRLLKNVH